MLRPRHLSSNSIIIAIIASIALITSGGFWLLSNANSFPDAQTKISPGAITVTGSIVCLPHKDTSGPQTMECAYGMKDADGAYYALQNLDQESLVNGTISVGKNVTVSGEVSQVASNEKYAIVGSIEIESITVNE